MTKVSALTSSIAILTQQVSHYHAARYRAASRVLPAISVVSVVNEADFPEFLAETSGGLRIFPLCDGKAGYLAAVADGGLATRVFALLDDLSPEVVAVAGWSFPESAAAIDWARRRGRRVIMMSESQQRDSQRSFLREMIKSQIVRACDAALVGGTSQAAYISHLGMPESSVFLGYDAVDNDHFSSGSDRARGNAGALRAALGLPEKYLLASARFIAKKNLERLVEAFALAVKAAKAPHSLVILGDGEGRLSIEQAIARTGLGERILLVGFKDYQSLPTYYGLAEAFVHVSLAEQWGLVINEAAAAGLPLLISRPCGAATELVVDGVNGYLIEPQDVADISRAIKLVVSLDAPARHAMGMESRRIASDWGPERFATNLALAVHAAMKRPARRLSLLDVAILRSVSRRFISKVR